jgi:type IV pilus assembly protein PilM
MFRKKVVKTPVIGIDIGTSYIKVAQFEEEKGKIRLINFGLFPTPPGCLERGKIVKEDELAETLSTLMTFHEFRGKRVAASISGQAVTVKQMIVEELPKQELAEVLKWELDKYIAYPLEQAGFDYQVLATEASSDNKGKAKYKCIVAAAPLEILEPLLATLKKANLEPFYFEADSFSELRLAEFSITKTGELKNSVLVFVNIGTSNTLVEITEGENILLTRIIPMGIDFLKEEIMERMEATPAEAENAILNLINLEKGAFFSEDMERKTTAVVKTKLEELMLEIKRSISFYHSRFEDAGEKETCLIFSGGGAAIKGIIPYMEAGLGLKSFENQYVLKVCDYDAEQFKASEMRIMAPLFSIAAGLALLDIEEKYARKTSRFFLGKKREEKKLQRAALPEKAVIDINEIKVTD